MNVRYFISASNMTHRIVFSKEGVHGVIEKAIYTRNGVSQAVAIKTCTANANAEKQLCSENKLFMEFAALNHPNMFYVVTYLGYMYEANKIAVVLELMEKGDLASWAASSAFSDRQCFDYFKHVAFGIRDIHKHGVIHRDIKPTNVLIGEVAKLADFGLAVRKCDTDVKAAGTPIFCAPEVHFGICNNNTEMADIYSYGLTCLAASRRDSNPFGSNLHNHAELKDLKKFLASMDDYSPLLMHLTADQLKLYAIILWCCNKKWNERPRAEDVVNEFNLGNVLSQELSMFAKSKVNAMLLKAIQGKSLEHVKLALQWGADINYVSLDGTSAFHMAVRSGDWDIYQLFIEKGLDLHNERNQTVILLAAGSGQALILEDLLARNLSANLHYNAGFSPVIVSIINNQKACLEILLKNNADPNFDKTRLALHEAVKFRRIEMIPLLLEYGAVCTQDIALNLEQMLPEERGRYIQAFKQGSELYEERCRATALVMRPILNS